MYSLYAKLQKKMIVDPKLQNVDADDQLRENEIQIQLSDYLVKQHGWYTQLPVSGGKIHF